MPKKFPEKDFLDKIKGTTKGFTIKQLSDMFNFENHTISKYILKYEGLDILELKDDNSNPLDPGSKLFKDGRYAKPYWVYHKNPVIPVSSDNLYNPYLRDSDFRIVMTLKINLIEKSIEYFKTVMIQVENKYSELLKSKKDLTNEEKGSFGLDKEGRLNALKMNISVFLGIIRSFPDFDTIYYKDLRDKYVKAYTTYQNLLYGSEEKYIEIFDEIISKFFDTHTRFSTMSNHELVEAANNKLEPTKPLVKGIEIEEPPTELKRISVKELSWINSPEYRKQKDMEREVKWKERINETHEDKIIKKKIMDRSQLFRNLEFDLKDNLNFDIVMSQNVNKPNSFIKSLTQKLYNVILKEIYEQPKILLQLKSIEDLKFKLKVKYTPSNSLRNYMNKPNEKTNETTFDKFAKLIYFIYNRQVDINYNSNDIQIEEIEEYRDFIFNKAGSDRAFRRLLVEYYHQKVNELLNYKQVKIEENEELKYKYPKTAINLKSGFHKRSWNATLINYPIKEDFSRMIQLEGILESLDNLTSDPIFNLETDYSQYEIDEDYRQKLIAHQTSKRIEYLFKRFEYNIISRIDVIFDMIKEHFDNYIKEIKKEIGIIEVEHINPPPKKKVKDDSNWPVMFKIDGTEKDFERFEQALKKKSENNNYS